MINHIQKSCDMKTINAPTIIYEDNAACVAQMHMGYIKSDLTKHIAPKFFYPHELQKSGELDTCKLGRVTIWQICSQSLCLPLVFTDVFGELA